MRRVFVEMHTSKSYGSWCPNQDCVPQSLLELSIEQSYGLQQIVDLALDKAHASKVQFKENFTLQKKQQ